MASIQDRCSDAYLKFGRLSALGVLMALFTLIAGGAAAQTAVSVYDPYEHFNQPVPKNPSLPTLFLIGDSMVHNGNGRNGQLGWGEPLAGYFDPSRINVVNRAIGARSSRTYMNEGRWDEVLAMVKPGDFVMIHFGSNDGAPWDEPTRARGSLPGIGEDSKEFENPLLKKHETVHTYGWYLRKYVSDTRAKGATPILCSPVPNNTWKDGRVARDTSTYGGWSRQVAEQEKIAYIDLNAIVSAHYEGMGQAKTTTLFYDTQIFHTTPEGAELNAQSVIEGLKALPNDPLARYFSARAASIAATPGR